MTIECGAAFAPVAGGVLTLTGDFPAGVSAAEQVVAGTVDVVAARDEARGVVTPLAEAFLVRDGRIVTLPLPQDAVGRNLDLSDGRGERLPAAASLVPCSGGGRLATGTYDLFVRVVLSLEDGSHTESFGGPWPLEVG